MVRLLITTSDYLSQMLRNEDTVVSDPFSSSQVSLESHAADYRGAKWVT